MKLKRLSLYGIAGAILVLDLLALDDITTGSEPSFVFEYLTLAASVVALFLLYYIGFRKKKA